MPCPSALAILWAALVLHLIPQPVSPSDVAGQPSPEFTEGAQDPPRGFFGTPAAMPDALLRLRVPSGEAGDDGFLRPAPSFSPVCSGAKSGSTALASTPPPNSQPGLRLSSCPAEASPALATRDGVRSPPSPAVGYDMRNHQGAEADRGWVPVARQERGGPGGGSFFYSRFPLALRGASGGVVGLSPAAEARLSRIEGGVAAIAAGGEQRSGTSSLLNALLRSGSGDADSLMDTFAVRPDSDTSDPSPTEVHAVLIPAEDVAPWVASATPDGVTAILLVDLPFTPNSGDFTEQSIALAMVAPLCKVVLLTFWADSAPQDVFQSFAIAAFHAKQLVGKAAQEALLRHSAAAGRDVAVFSQPWPNLILLSQGSAPTDDWSDGGDASFGFHSATPPSILRGAESARLGELFSEVYAVTLPAPSLDDVVLSDLSLASLSELHAKYRSGVAALLQDIAAMAAGECGGGGRGGWDSGGRSPPCRGAATRAVQTARRRRHGGRGGGSLGILPASGVAGSDGGGGVAAGNVAYGGWPSGAAAASALRLVAEVAGGVGRFPPLPTRLHSWVLRMAQPFGEQLEQWGREGVVRCVAQPSACASTPTPPPEGGEEPVPTREEVHRAAARLADSASTLFASMVASQPTVAQMPPATESSSPPLSPSPAAGAGGDGGEKGEEGEEGEAEKRGAGEEGEVTTPPAGGGAGWRALRRHIWGAAGGGDGGLSPALSLRWRRLRLGIAAAAGEAEVARRARLADALSAFAVEAAALLDSVLEGLGREALPVTPDARVAEMLGSRIDEAGIAASFAARFTRYDEEGVHEVRDASQALEARVAATHLAAAEQNTQLKLRMFASLEGDVEARFMALTELHNATHVESAQAGLDAAEVEVKAAWGRQATPHEGCAEYEEARAAVWGVVSRLAAGRVRENDARIAAACGAEMRKAVGRFERAVGDMFREDTALLPHDGLRDRAVRQAALVAEEFSAHVSQLFFGPAAGHRTQEVVSKLQSRIVDVLELQLLPPLRSRWTALFDSIVSCAEATPLNTTEFRATVSRSHVAKMVRVQAESCYRKITNSQSIPRAAGVALRKWADDAPIVSRIAWLDVPLVRNALFVALLVTVVLTSLSPILMEDIKAFFRRGNE